jgi:tRNA-specific 2-thiouridylase
MASSLGLSNAQRQESQDICFLKGYDKDDFLADKISTGKGPGDIVDKNGKLLGRHKGVLGYTIGQREGLGIATGNPLYVLGIDVSANRLVVGDREDLLKSSCMVNNINWVSIEKPNTAIEAYVQIRARHAPAKATIIPKSDDSFIIEFDEPQPAITPGQAAVLYRDDTVMGGGWIV